jgi:hypothetical protein
MRDTRKAREDDSKRGRASDDDSRSEATWYEECGRPSDDPLITTIPLPDGK